MNNVANLHGSLRTSELNINSKKINVNDIALVYDEMMPRHFWIIAKVTGVLPSTDYQKRVSLRVAKTNTILKRPVNKLFRVENTYHDTYQTDKVREQTLRQEAAVIGELKIKYIY